MGQVVTSRWRQRIEGRRVRGQKETTMSVYRETGPASLLVAAFSGNVFGLDPATGRVRWEQELDTAGNPSALVITESFVYVATYSTLACLEYRTGKVVWSVL